MAPQRPFFYAHMLLMHNLAGWLVNLHNTPQGGGGVRRTAQPGSTVAWDVDSGAPALQRGNPEMKVAGNAQREQSLEAAGGAPPLCPPRREARTASGARPQKLSASNPCFVFVLKLLLPAFKKISGVQNSIK